VPAVESVEDRDAKHWAMVATVCRRYDAEHGTTSSIRQIEPGDPMNRIVSDTPCTGSGGGYAVAL
jgi:hypothetical protein